MGSGPLPIEVLFSFPCTSRTLFSQDDCIITFKFLLQYCINAVWKKGNCYPTLTLKVPDWRIWAYTDGQLSCPEWQTKIGAGVYCPLTDNKNFVEPNDAGPYVELNQQQLLLPSRTVIHIASDNLTSFN
eukprot:1160983-Pelagomonas_calceolata.AAC.15